MHLESTTAQELQAVTNLSQSKIDSLISDCQLYAEQCIGESFLVTMILFTI